MALDDSASVLVLDFDGTIALSDIGYTICRRFVGEAARPPIERWMRGELSLGEAQALIWPQVRAGREAVMAYVAEIGELRPGLDELLAFAERRAWPVVIASGGFDFYVHALLGGERLSRVEAICNRGWFTDDGMAVDFPHAELSCARCAICKGQVLAALQRRGHRRTIFVGDGLSDRCAAGRAHLLFALRGGELEDHCKREAVSYHPYDDLFDVARSLEQAAR